MAGSTRQSREHKKWLTARRAQFRLKQQLDYIDFVEDVLNPESEALLAGTVKLEIEQSSDAAAQSIIHVEISEPDKEAEDAADTSQPPFGDGE